MTARPLRILVANSKGGCGKTTLATNLASAFAAAGLETGLVDHDRQKSSLEWLDRRPAEAAPIRALDGRKGYRSDADGLGRIVIDAPAALRPKDMAELVAAADLVVVPVLPSAFDEAGTARFLERLDALKPVRRDEKAVLVVANRMRRRARAGLRLLERLDALGRPAAATLSERSAYADLAAAGLGLFDMPRSRVAAMREDWTPLVRAVERRG